MLIISIDVDVGNRELGVINKGNNDLNVHRHYSEYSIGKMDEAAFPLFIEIFNNFNVPATFAIRGQLTEVNVSIIKSLREAPVEHDIGAHGYYHREFTNLSCNEAEDELCLISKSMRRLGIIPRGFVFPRGSVAHLDLLEKYGYKCYRDYGDFRRNCMHIEKQGQLCNVHPSLYLSENITSMFAKLILDIAITRKLPFHIWFHLWSFGETKESMKRNIRKLVYPLLNYAKKKEKSSELTFETMLSATKKVEKLGLKYSFPEGAS